MSLRSLSAEAGSFAAGAWLLAAGAWLFAAGAPGPETEEPWSRSPRPPQPASAVESARPAASTATIFFARSEVTAGACQRRASRRSTTCSGHVRASGDDVGGWRYRGRGADGERGCEGGGAGAVPQVPAADVRRSD